MSVAGTTSASELTALVTTHASMPKGTYAEWATELKLVRVVYCAGIACQEL